MAESASWREEVAGSSLLRWGVRAWMFLGVLLALAATLFVLGLASGIVIPLVVALVLGGLFAPVVERLRDAGLPPAGGASVVLLGLAVVVAGSVWLVVAGVLDQAGQVSASLDDGVAELGSWLAGHGIDSAGLPAEAGGLGGLALEGLPGLLGGALTGIAALLVGLVIAVFLLYYVLVDWDGVRGWLGAHVGLAPDVGTAAVDDAVDSVRRYFWSLTLSAVVTAVLIGGTAWGLGVPLAFTIAVITLTTSYVPYIGAIFSGAFATLIALGSSGVQTAVVLLVVVLVVQNVVQTVVLARLSSSALSLHPIVTMSSTIVGAAFAGILGATLATPAVAAAVLVHRRIASAPRAGLDKE